ncbi:MAG: class I adenylate-forming enzyme family protein [Acidimicrobiia bacterium]
MTTDGAFTWGTEVRRREDGIPFLEYEPRRRRLPELFEDTARWASRVHLVQGERRITYRSLFQAVEGVATELAARGVRPGDRVLLLAVNSPEWVVSFWGALAVGAVMAPGNGWWSEEEAAHVVSRIEPALVIGDERGLAKLPGDSLPTMPCAEVAAIVDAASASVDADPSAPVSLPGVAGEPADEDEDEAALIVFTSGTTGFPKGAALAHRSILANMHDLMARSRRLPHQIDPDRPGPVSLAMGPLFHIGGIQSLCLALVGGATLVFLEGRFDSTRVLDLIETERVTVWGGVPTMARRVVEDPTLAGRDLTCVRSITLGGAPVPPEVVGRLRSAFPNADRGVSTVYGMTETGGTVASASGALMVEHPGTSGRVQRLVDLRIAHPDATGEGEVLVRTPGQMLRYWGEGAESDRVIDDEGFVHTGDLGRLSDGLLWITGRSKDVIIRGGENIAAPRVEAILLEHPDVVEVAVVGLENADLGEEVGAAVLPRAGVDTGAEELAAFLRARLAHFEVPTRWWFTDEPLPTNEAGKVDKRSLKSKWPA